MKILHVIGKKKHGKTTLITDLIEELVKRGLKVGTIKHCGHDHELDTPGTDSFKHRQAGASQVAIFTPSLQALYKSNKLEEVPYDELKAHFEDSDLVLIEGDRTGPGPKLEVWLAENGTKPLATEIEGIDFVVTDDTPEADLKTLPRNDVAAVADVVIELAREI